MSDDSPWPSAGGPSAGSGRSIGDAAPGTPAPAERGVRDAPPTSGRHCPDVDAPVRSYLGDATTIRLAAADSDGRLGISDHDLAPGSATPWHVHAHDDEALVVLRGCVEVAIGAQRFVAGPDDAIFAPRGVPHAWRVVSPGGARVLMVTTPGGHEQLFLDAGDRLGAVPASIDLDRLRAAAARVGVTILGPPPFAEGSVGVPRPA